MTEEKTEKTFEPILDQGTFDERIKARLARERERWEKSGQIGELHERLRHLDDELTQARAEALEGEGAA
jgi:hypothetical protein